MRPRQVAQLMAVSIKTSLRCGAGIRTVKPKRDGGHCATVTVFQGTDGRPCGPGLRRRDGRRGTPSGRFDHTATRPAFIELGLACGATATNSPRRCTARCSPASTACLDEQMRDLLMSSSVLANIETAERIYLGEAAVSAIEAPDDALVYARRWPISTASRVCRVHWPGGGSSCSPCGLRTSSASSRRSACREQTRDLNRISLLRQPDLRTGLTEYQAERDRWQTHRSTVKGRGARPTPRPRRTRCTGPIWSLPNASWAISYRRRVAWDGMDRRLDRLAESGGGFR